MSVCTEIAKYLFLFDLELSIDQLKSVMTFLFVAHDSYISLQNELKPEPDDLWEEPTENATTWLPCANQRSQEHTREFFLILNTLNLYRRCSLMLRIFGIDLK